jgi:hypothetical protein
MTPQFERSLKGLRREKGGAAAMAARKADEFIKCLIHGSAISDRGKFSFTWNGEYRIKNCKKIDLVGAYRLVLIQKDHNCVLLYIGSHDDCFRWIERNKGITYEVGHSTNKISVVQRAGEETDTLPEDVLEEKEFVERYEQELLKKLDDNQLATIFPGWCRNAHGRDRNIEQ